MRTLAAYRIVMFLTEKCNMNCFYCDIGQIEDQKDTDKELLEKYFPLLNGRDDFAKNITITGGEPGLVDSDILHFIFTEVKPCHDVRVNTNGTFIGNGYFDKYYDKIKWVGYHPTVDIENLEYIIHKLEPDDKIDIFQPVHKKNLGKIAEVVKTNPDFKFTIMPVHEKTYFDEAYRFQKDDYLALYKEICDIPNVEPGSKNLAFRMWMLDEENLKIQRKHCGNAQIHPTFDFAAKQIMRCPISRKYTDKIDLCEENFKRAMKFDAFQNSENDKACLSCNEFFKYFDYYLHNSLVRETNGTVHGDE